jgi:hypothetical protein
VLLAFVTMTGNFSGVPLAFAFIIILGINGAVTLLLKSWGLIDGFNLYSGSGLILVTPTSRSARPAAALPGVRRAAGCVAAGTALLGASEGSMCGTWRCRC